MLFGPYGTITNSTIWKDKATGRSKGYGLVQFTTPEEASTAITGLNGYVLEGHNQALEVKYADTPETKSLKQGKGGKGATQFPQPAPGATRYHPYSRPAPAPRAAPRAAPRGPQHFDPQPRAAFSMPQVQPTALHGQGAIPFGQGPLTIPTVNYAVPEEGSNLFVRNLSSRIDELAVHKLFGQFGAISSVRVELNLATGASKGYGFVKYFYAADALNAVGALNGVEFDGRPMDVSFHKPKGV